ncbi:hypothetical protein [Citrobacter werkmanii]|uniref:hypothetical protein n=1 Tax=Citrobacter werkmanii TaxID=67827 RepID=UPI00311FE51B
MCTFIFSLTVICSKRNQRGYGYGKKEWVDGLRWLSVDQVVDLHFKLQEEIKKHYKLRNTGDHLERAIQLCEQQIALSELSLPALKAKHNAQAKE